MANAILTPTMVTREILRIAHEKLRFIGTTQRQYDKRFAQTGAKIGESLQIRLPNQYLVRTGKTLNAQDTAEESVTLTCATQKGVDMTFSSAELTLELDDFSKRIIEPAMAVLCSNIEGSMLNYVTPKVWNHVGTPGTLPTFLQVNQAKAKLNKDLAPDGNRHIQMESADMAGVVNEVKGLFHDSKEIAKQYREGLVGRGAGLDWHENERVYVHTVGADASGTTNITFASGATTVTTSSVAMLPGDIFTMATCFAVHPETKVRYAHLKQFVCTGVVDANNYTFSPPIISTGAKQNVSALPASGQAVVVVGTAAGIYPNHLVYHEEAFAFVTADLEMPGGVDFAAREVMDGLSVRVVRQYDINSDNIPCRIDILHGYEALRPQWACRVMGKGE